MKKVKYLKGLILGAFVFLIGILISLGTMKGVEVHADATVDLNYEVYKLDDYLLKFKFEDVYGVDLDSAKSFLEEYEIRYQDAIDAGDSVADATAAAESYWDGTEVTDYNSQLITVTNAKVTSGPTASDFQEDWWLGYPVLCGPFAGGTLKYYEKTGGSGANTRYTTKTATVPAGAGFSYAQIKTAVAEAEAVEPLSTVNEGDYIVILPIISTDGLTLGGASVGLDIEGLTAVTADPTNKFSGKYKKLSDVNDEILIRINEIKYIPNEVDDNLFILSMSDGNYIYINNNTLSKLNDYLSMLKTFNNKKGILHLDSGDYFEIVEHDLNQEILE